MHEACTPLNQSATTRVTKGEQQAGGVSRQQLQAFQQEISCEYLMDDIGIIAAAVQNRSS
jgi:hypothetical protein